MDEKADKHRDELEITPELQAEIDRARQEFEEGKGVFCRTKEELHAFFESL